MTDRRAALPSVERLLNEPAIAALLRTVPRASVLGAVRSVLASARRSRAGIPTDWATEVAERLQAEHTELVPVLNATGVVLHTNLGRAPLAPRVVETLSRIAAGYSTLELDIPSGARGARGEHSRRLLVELTGAEDALVVNNAAGALVLSLRAVADGRDVAISRGELIEIGGSFRVPEIIATAGIGLREIGTTNRTHLDDYGAVLDSVGAVLIVHRSNFTQRGFVTTPAPADVVGVAHAASRPAIYDLGGGLLHDLTAYGLVGEPLVGEAVAAGADIVVFSGDKLLGGPQAGILVGSGAAIARCRRHPFARAVRADKLTLAALAATLELHRNPESALRDVPVLRMLTLSPAELEARAARLLAHCRGLDATLVTGESAVGGGAFPDATLPTTLLAVDPGELGAGALALRLRLGEPAVLARVGDGRLLFDPRTLSDAELEMVAAALRRALARD